MASSQDVATASSCQINWPPDCHLLPNFVAIWPIVKPVLKTTRDIFKHVADGRKYYITQESVRL